MADLGQEDGAFVSPALGATAAQFLGGSGGGPPASGPGNSPPLISIRPDMLSPGSDTPYRLHRSQSRALGFLVVQPLRPDLVATGRVMLGQGRMDYRLPAGLGILHDPARIGFDTEFALAEAGVSWRHRVAKGVVGEAGIALGRRETRTHTSVSSALLNVHNVSQQGNTYLALRGDLEFSPRKASGRKPRLRLGSEIRLSRAAGVNFLQHLALDY